MKKLLNKYKVGRYYRLDIRDDGFDFELDETTMDADASRLANGNSELANKRLQRWKRHMGTIAKQFGGIRQRIGRGQLHGKDKASPAISVLPFQWILSRVRPPQFR